MSFYLKDVSFFLDRNNIYCGIRSKDVAQIRDLHIQGHRIGVTAVAPHGVQNIVARYQYTDTLRQQHQYISLPGRQVLGYAIVCHCRVFAVKQSFPNHILTLSDCLSVFKPLTYSRYQFLRIKRFGYVVIAFQPETFQPVSLFSAVGKEKQEHLVVCLAYLLSKLEAV